MVLQYTPLERAFALAASGEYNGPAEIKTKMKSEGYETAQVTGPSLLRQLRAACAKARLTDPPG